MTSLPPNAAVERRARLKEYILLCIRDNILSLSDLASPGVLDKLLNAVTTDVRGVLADLGRSGGAGALRLAAVKFMEFAAGLDSYGKGGR